MLILAQTLLLDCDFDLRLEQRAGADGLRRVIKANRIQKPGLALSGYKDAVESGSIQILGQTEVRYLVNLQDTPRRAALANLFDTELACIVLTHGLEAPIPLLEQANNHNVPLFSTIHRTEHFIERIHHFLDEYLSQEVTKHGVMLDIFGVGVMLTGKSGIGKSECALDLILRGHRLVADDVVHLKPRSDMILATGSDLTRHHMEVRGLGIINVQDLFGAAAVRKEKRLELLVDMLEWKNGMEYDRTGVDTEYDSILEFQVPKIRLPIRPGRNIASIVEVAARNHLLKTQGHHSAKIFEDTVLRRLEWKSKPDEKNP
jgi:HPr kinase/phosphorylase